ncbi:hypothetical protein AWZ03_000823 [Drosophila navojoa]|uniref:Uncharacterized protein n=1 Tax=Drosophila navojoa TaxID=7232 RepID=A0A484BWX7_DRONA|nr:hypothetical protein AWZ03_000823 [Drosophila navojoa]
MMHKPTATTTARAASTRAATTTAATTTTTTTTTTNSTLKSSNNTGLFTFDAHPYFSFPMEPYTSSKYGSQVRERKIDRCLKQLQEALKISK